MKQFAVFKKDRPDAVLAYCDTKQEANDEIIGMAEDTDDMVFDYDVREIETQEPAEICPTYEIACKYLGRDPKVAISSDGNAYVKPLEAMHKLLTIGEAWNKIDGFIPDYGNRSQTKWFPYFYYDKDSAGFVCAATNNAPATATASIGSRPCFKSSNRARQFGEMFAELYNIAILEK